jgi:hypothetical protein
MKHILKGREKATENNTKQTHVLNTWLSGGSDIFPCLFQIV